MICIGEKKIPWKEGITVAQALASTGDDDYYVVVKVNGRLVSRPNFEKTVVTDESEILPLPMIAGG